MRLSSDAVLIELGGVPMAGNPETGALVGLTEEGEALCRELSERDVSPAEVAPGCLELVDALGRNGLLEGAPGARRGLDSAYLHVTQRCNLACRHCYSEGDDRNRAADPSLAQLRRAVALLASLGCARLVISGGEPFLRGDLADVASFARDRGVGEVVVLTNGLLVDEKGIDPLVGLVSCVAVAFDGASADAPAPLRGTQRFGRLVRAVETIRDAGIEARILPTLHAGNLDEVPRYRRLADELGASLSFSLLTAPADELGDLRLSDEQLHELGRRPRPTGRPAGSRASQRAVPAERARGPSASPPTGRSTPVTCCTTARSPWAAPSPTRRGRPSRPSRASTTSTAARDAACATSAGAGAVRGPSWRPAASSAETRTASSPARTTRSSASSLQGDSERGEVMDMLFEITVTQRACIVIEGIRIGV